MDEAEAPLAAKPSVVSVPVDHIRVSAYMIPTDYPESDGTLAWNATTLILTEVAAGGQCGLGYTYSDLATAQFISDTLVPLILGTDVMNIPYIWNRMTQRVRNMGLCGITTMGIAAIDTALWDIKAKLLQLPLARLLGCTRERVPVYGSGGFTSYNKERLQKQLSQWAEDGFFLFKIKIGREPWTDLQRIEDAREAIGYRNELFVDANGAYSRKLALGMAERFAGFGVSWFEEPVPSSDLEGLNLLRDRAPGGMDIAVGEYGYTLMYFREMLKMRAVDVLQADASRCAGITGFLAAAKLCQAFEIPFSSHCCPALHIHAATALEGLLHMEYFYDHARIENMLFDGVTQPIDGFLAPDLSSYGLGLELKRQDAAPFLQYFREHFHPKT